MCIRHLLLLESCFRIRISTIHFYKKEAQCCSVSWRTFLYQPKHICRQEISDNSRKYPITPGNIRQLQEKPDKSRKYPPPAASTPPHDLLPVSPGTFENVSYLELPNIHHLHCAISSLKPDTLELLKTSSVWNSRTFIIILCYFLPLAPCLIQATKHTV